MGVWIRTSPSISDWVRWCAMIGCFCVWHLRKPVAESSSIYVSVRSRGWARPALASSRVASRLRHRVTLALITHDEYELQHMAAPSLPPAFDIAPSERAPLRVTCKHPTRLPPVQQCTATVPYTYFYQSSRSLFFVVFRFLATSTTDCNPRAIPIIELAFLSFLPFSFVFVCVSVCVCVLFDRLLTD